MLVIQNPNGRESTFEVKYFVFKGALSSPYSLVVDVLDVNESIKPRENLYLPATLEFIGSTGEMQSISGVITRLERRQDPIQQKTIYAIRIEPYLSLLAQQNLFKVHNNKSYLAIVKSIIQRLSSQYHLSEYASFSVDMPWLTTPLQTFDVECEANTLDYFNKLLGFVRYYFTEGEGRESLVVIDRPGLLPSRDRSFVYDPSRKEDLKDGTASFYHLAARLQSRHLTAQPIYFDYQDPQASLAKLKDINDPLVVSIPIYAPIGNYDFIKAKLTEQLHHDKETHHFKSYYSNILVGERFSITTPLCSGSLDVFVESLEIEGHYQDESWRFDVNGILRPYSEDGAWLGPYQPRAKLPAVIPGAMLKDQGQVNDAGMYQVKFPQGFDLGGETPTVSVREIQETVTQGGGASHSVSGKANVVLVTQDGQPYDLLLMGSLNDATRPSHITTENYRESGVKTAGGLDMHLRRADGNNNVSEAAIKLSDSQGNAAHVTLGAHERTLSEAGERAHGIRTQSTGYAKRVVAGNDYDTVGDPNNPVTQHSLVNENGKTVHASQINVGEGLYQETYYTKAKGIKVNQTPKPPKKMKTNPNLKHYFYVVPAAQSLVDLSKNLFGSTLSSQKLLFQQINGAVYENELKPGEWVYVPMANEQYEIGDVVQVQTALNTVKSQVDDNQESGTLASYGFWHQVFGWNYENTLALTGAYLKTSSEQINAHLGKISQHLNKLGQINQESKAAGNVIDAALYQEQTRIVGEELHQDVSQLVRTFSLPDPGFASSFASDTGLSYNANILGFKADALSETDLVGLTKLKTQSLKMAKAAKGVGYLSAGLDVAAAGDDIYQTCQKYGNGSTLCHETAVGDSAQVGAGEVISGITATAASEWLGCNAALDLETAGAGVLICTIGVAAASVVAGDVAGDAAKVATEKGYQKAVVYSQQFGVNKAE